MPSPIVTRFLAALLPLVMTLPSLARVLHECSMRGNVSARACCCPEMEKAQPPPQASFRPNVAPCCTDELTKGDVLIATTFEFEAWVPAAAAPSAMPDRSIPESTSLAVSRARGPPGQGPPIFLLHRSLLV